MGTSCFLAKFCWPAVRNPWGKKNPLIQNTWLCGINACLEPWMVHFELLVNCLQNLGESGEIQSTVCSCRRCTVVALVEQLCCAASASESEQVLCGPDVLPSDEH